MTKVSLKVTRELSEVPKEVGKQLEGIASQLTDVLGQIEKIKSAADLDLPMKTIAGQVALQHESCQKILESIDDLFNICKSYYEIMKESEDRQKEEEATKIVEDKIKAFKINAEAQIGQALAKENLMSTQIEDLKKQVKLLKGNSSQKTTKKTTTRKK